MNQKAKKILYRIFKIIWIAVGILIALITFLLYLKMYSTSGLGVIAVALLVAAGVYALFIYAGITILFLLIKFIIKLIGKRKIRKKK